MRVVFCQPNMCVSHVKRRKRNAAKWIIWVLLRFSQKHRESSIVSNLACIGSLFVVIHRTLAHDVWRTKFMWATTFFFQLIQTTWNEPQREWFRTSDRADHESCIARNSRSFNFFTALNETYIVVWEEKK